MIITEPQIPAMRTHVSLLSNDRIDQLVCQHIFKQSPICHGRMEASINSGSLRCTECAALIVETAAMRAFEDTGHARHVTLFSTSIAPAWSVVDVLRARDEAMRTLFVLYLDALVKAEFELRHPGLRYSKLWFVMGLSPRLVCIAALQAVEAVDDQGYLVESEVVL